MLLAILILQIATLLAYLASGAVSVLYLRRSDRRSVADQVAHEHRMAALGDTAPRIAPRPGKTPTGPYGSS
jgi:hypothetical protein